MAKSTSITSNNDKSTEWYTEEQLYDLLQHYVGADNIYISQALSTEEELLHHLSQLPQLNKPQSIIPLNNSALTGELDKGNHWVGLHILINNSSNSVVVNYINPMGFSINSNVEKTIKQTLPSLFTSITIEQPLLHHGIQESQQKSSIELFGNINDCGPMLVYITACRARAVDLISINSYEESISLGSFLRESFSKLENFNSIYSTFCKNDNNNPSPEVKVADVTTSISAEQKKYDSSKALNKAPLANEEVHTYIGSSNNSVISEELRAIKDKSNVILQQDLSDKTIIIEQLKQLEETSYKPLVKELVYKNDPEGLKNLVTLFKDLGYLHQKFGDLSENLKYYTDSATFYQYCLTLIEEKVNPNKNDQLYNQKTEELYQSLNQLKQALIEYISFSSIKSASSAKEETDSNKKYLKSLRDHSREMLKEIDNYSLQSREARLATNIDKEQEFNDLYINSSKDLFIHIANTMRGFLAKLYSVAEQEVGSPPCKYTVAGLGSLALKQITPYSDFECMILTENEEYKSNSDPKVRNYFKNMSHLVNFKLINLGESIIPTSKYNVNLGHLVHQGVNFDLGGKTPLGRIDQDKPYDLVQTIDKMMRYVRDEKDNATRIDKNLSKIVSEVCYIYGDEQLIDTYQQQVRSFYQSRTDDTQEDSPLICEERALKYLMKGTVEHNYSQDTSKPVTTSENGELDRFIPSHVSFQKEGRIFDVKQEIYRLPDRFLYDLGLYYGIEEKGAWATIEELYKSNIIEESAARNLKYASTFAINLRLKAYLHNKGQREDLNILGLSQANDEQQIKEEQAKIFHLPQEELQENGGLFKYYYVASPLHQSLVEFCDSHGGLSKQQKHDYFQKNTFYEESYENKGKLHYRLSHRKEALENLELAMNKEGKRDVLSIKSTFIELLIQCEKLDKAKKLTQEWLVSIDKQEKEKELELSLVLNLSSSIHTMLGGEENLKLAQKHQSEALEIRQGLYTGNHLSVATLFNNSSCIYEKLGGGENLKKALRYSLKALKMEQELFPDNHPGVASLLNNIGLIYSKLGGIENLKESLNYSLKALSMYQELYPGNHPSVATSLNGLSFIYLILEGKESLKEALDYSLKALKMEQELFPDNHPGVATSLNNTGSIYHALGGEKNQKEALDYSLKALKMRQELYLEDHPDVATSLSNIGSTYHALGGKENLKKALKYLSETLRIRQKLYPGNHPSVVNALNSVSYIYRDFGGKENLEKALNYSLNALKMEYKLSTGNHPDIANSLNNVGLIYKKLGGEENLNKALDYFLEALRIRQELYSNNHLDVAISLNNAGSIHQALGGEQNLQEALKYSLEALAMSQALYPGNHPDVVVAAFLSNVGSIYKALRGEQNLQEALKYFLEALAMSQELYLDNHLEIVENLDNLGAIYLELSNYEEGLKFFQEALKLRKKILGDNHPDVAQSMNNLGMTYLMLGNYEEALKLFQGDLDLRKKILGEKHPNIAQSMNSIGNVYEKLGQHAKALQYYLEALEIRKEVESNPMRIIASFINVTKIHKELGNHVEAEKYYLEGLRLLGVQSLNSPPTIAQGSEPDRKTAVDENTKKEKTEISEPNEISTSITTQSGIAEKQENTIRVISYNIIADYFDSKDQTQDEHHHWSYRASLVKNLLKMLCPDIMCLQELSPKQALELHEYFSGSLGYQSAFLSQTPASEKAKAGTIVYGDEVAKWRDEFIGTPLVGTFIKASYKFVEVNKFWLNESPDTIPEDTDRSETDKGFGNMNTYRAVLWAKVEADDGKVIFIFNSYYPLSGGNNARLECAKLEMAKIKEIAGSNHWVSAGDRNIIPTKDDNEFYNPQTVHQELTSYGKDICSSRNHYGINTTWIGFSYDDHQNQIKGEDFEESIILDVMISNLKSICSFYHHGAFNPITGELLPLMGALTEAQNEGRYFTSDHALIGADLLLPQEE